MRHLTFQLPQVLHCNFPSFARNICGSFPQHMSSFVFSTSRARARARALSLLFLLYFMLSCSIILSLDFPFRSVVSLPFSLALSISCMHAFSPLLHLSLSPLSLSLDQSLKFSLALSLDRSLLPICTRFLPSLLLSTRTYT